MWRRSGVQQRIESRAHRAIEPRGSGPHERRQGTRRRHGDARSRAREGAAAGGRRMRPPCSVELATGPEPRAFARATDPDTARAAAASIDVTRLEGLILDKLRRYSAPGATTFELAEVLGLEVISVSPRMKPLQKKGLIRDSGFRARGASGRCQIIWRAS